MLTQEIEHGRCLQAVPSPERRGRIAAQEFDIRVRSDGTRIASEPDRNARRLSDLESTERPTEANHVVHAAFRIDANYVPWGCPPIHRPEQLQKLLIARQLPPALRDYITILAIDDPE